MKTKIFMIFLTIIIILLSIKYINLTYNYNLFGYINIVDGNDNTRKHEVAHSIYNNLSKEDKISYLYKMNSEEFLGETYGTYVSRELIRVDNIYNFQIFFNKNILKEELFAYYVQMKQN